MKRSNVFDVLKTFITTKIWQLEHQVREGLSLMATVPRQMSSGAAAEIDIRADISGFGGESGLADLRQLECVSAWQQLHSNTC